MGKIEDALLKAKSERLGRSSTKLTTPPGLRSDSIVNDRPAQNRVTPAMLPAREDDILENRVVSPAAAVSAGTSAYRMMRTRLLQRMRANNWTTLAVTSAEAGDGKSLTSINLAASIARDEGQYVFLADMDLRHPSIANYLGIDPDNRFQDYLADRIGVDKLLVSPGWDRLAAVVNEQAYENSSELLASAKISNLMNELRSMEPSCIICDMPPVLASDDVLAFAEHIDAILLVVSETKTRRQELRRAYEYLQGINIAGVVLNRSLETPTQSYYYPAASR